MKLHTLSIKVPLLMAIGFSIAGTAYSNTLTGDEIVLKVNQRDEGKTLSRNLTMQMIDRAGKKRVRETRSLRKYFGDEKRTVIYYKSPKNIKDTAFLTLDYADKTVDDDQWLYLPAMRKVRRISASDRGDYFLGTDFTYEEIKLESRVSITDYERKVIGEDMVDGFHCIIVEAKVVTPEIANELGHSRREDCFDDNIWIMRKSVLWDEKGQLLKTIHFRDIEKIQNIWSVQSMVVDNHKTKHQSTFSFSNIDYLQPVKDEMFSKNTLKRGL